MLRCRVELPTRCAAPTVRGRSTHTVLGFLGYVIGNVLGIVLAELWQLDLRDRLVMFLLPPLAFIVVVFAVSW